MSTCSGFWSSPVGQIMNACKCGSIHPCQCFNMHLHSIECIELCYRLRACIYVCVCECEEGVFGSHETCLEAPKAAPEGSQEARAVFGRGKRAKTHEGLVLADTVVIQVVELLSLGIIVNMALEILHAPFLVCYGSCSKAYWCCAWTRWAATWLRHQPSALRA